MAKPHPRGPRQTIDIYCAACRTQLFTYRKGGKGALVKCFKERITKDFTTQPGMCPQCGAVFARETMVRGAPAYKIVSGKVVWK